MAGIVSVPAVRQSRLASGVLIALGATLLAFDLLAEVASLARLAAGDPMAGWTTFYMLAFGLALALMGGFTLTAGWLLARGSRWGRRLAWAWCAVTAALCLLAAFTQGNALWAAWEVVGRGGRVLTALPRLAIEDPAGPTLYADPRSLGFWVPAVMLIAVVTIGVSLARSRPVHPAAGDGARVAPAARPG